MNESGLLRVAGAAKAALPIASLQSLVIVAVVAECPDQTAAEYCRLSGLAKKTVYRLLIGLARRSTRGRGPLLHRFPSPASLLEVTYRLSPEGQAVIQAMLGALDGRPNGARGAVPRRSRVPVAAEVQP